LVHWKQLNRHQQLIQQPLREQEQALAREQEQMQLL
jgi:hypothetical protein